MSSEAPDAGTRLREFGRRSLFTGIGGGIFAFLAVRGLNGWGGIVPYLFVALVALVLMRLSVAMLRRAQRLGVGTSRFARQRRAYLVITGLEYAGFVAVAVGCTVTNQVAWVVPLDLVVSGAHFLGPGATLRIASAYVKGMLLCATAIVTVLVLPQDLMVAGTAVGSVQLWWVAAGFAGTLICWADVAVALATALRVVRSTSYTADLFSTGAPHGCTGLPCSRDRTASL